jgi:hypothetical protein
MGIRDKKVGNLRDKFVKRDEESKKKKGGDKRFLNYFDLGYGQKMTIRLLPDGGDSGEYYLKYSTHGPNLKTRGVEGIQCPYDANGDDCPACGYSYDFYNDGNKEEAGKWRRKETFVGQCLVIDSPIEINETDDGNPVKLMYIPWGMLEQINEAVMEQQVDEPMDVDFVIKKTKNSGGFASYDKSYFMKEVEPLDDEILDAFDSGEMNLFDLSKELPAPATTEDVEEWLEKTIETVTKANSRQNRTNHDDGVDDDVDDQKYDDEQKDDEAGENKPPKKTSAKSLMDRLKKKSAA